MSALRIIALTLLVLAVSAFGAWKLSGLRDFQLFGELVSRVETDRPVVALTFDDGPTRGYTERILEILDAYDVPATFFLVGEAMERAPQQTRMIVEAGHEVGNHSWSHQRMVLKSPRFVAAELERTDALIREAGYTGDIHFRPPYGKRLVVLPWYLSRHGIKTITWDVDPDSGLGRRAGRRELVEYVVSEAAPGSIILLHVMFAPRVEVMEALPGIIEGLRARGLGFRRVSELLATDLTAIPVAIDTSQPLPQPASEFALGREPMDQSHLIDLATRYAAAWSGGQPERLAAFYAENGRLVVNDGEPAVGREAIAAKAAGFMEAFPDMEVRLRRVVERGGVVEFHWRWTGTNTGPGGTGRAVDLIGHEAWTLDEDGLIVQSLGHYDAAEYERQLTSESSGSR